MNLHIERTTDEALIRSVLDLPEIKHQVTEGEVAVPAHADIYYLAVKEPAFADGSVEDCLVGVVAFMPVNSITWNPHIAILPTKQDQGVGTSAMRAAVAWMFANSPCRKLVAHPPSFKGAMIRVFEKCGFRIEGMSPASFKWNGRVYDRMLMGLESSN